MATYKLNPTYYRVTWDQTAPTNYTGLTGTQAGGLDSSTPLDYNSRISITGATANPTMVAGDTLVINGETIAFGNDNLATIIATINMYSTLTKVIAHNDVSATYVTITNAQGYEAEPISIEEGNGGLANLGIAANVYTTFPCVVGGAFAGLVADNKLMINGAVITFPVGYTNKQGVVNRINETTYLTGVTAQLAANTIQINSVNGLPIATTLAAGTVDPSLIGFPAGIYDGEPNTLAESTSKALANLRWQMVVMQLEQFATPFVVNYQFGTGNFSGSSELDTFSFTIGYERPDQIATYELAGEPNPGNLLTGIAAIKRAVARGMVATYNSNVNLFDPTAELRNNCAIRPNPVRIVNLTATGVDTLANIATVEGNIEVSIIAFE